MKSLLLVLTAISSAKTRSAARMVLEEAGHRVIEAGGYVQAQSLLNNGLDPDLVVCEACSPVCSRSKSYHDFLQGARAQTICVITSSDEREEVCRQAASAGIKHVLTAPITRGDFEPVFEALRHSRGRAGENIATLRAAENQPLRTEGADEEADIPRGMFHAPYVEELGGGNFFLAASPAMLEIHRQVKLLADIDVNVLILGESGTGKEVVAQLIHKNSRRSREKFLKVNCAALPTDLLESELFGHRQGAFTGAINDCAGKFEQANRGTLLLDEIGEIPVQMQAKLLHVLQDGRFARLGAQETTKVDVRVLAATNINMEDALLKKAFREDLYYRLSVFTIKVPPLRERREEIPYLIEENIRRAPGEMARGFGTSLPSRLMDLVLLYDWRGNLRELRNFVTRMMVMRDMDAATQELQVKVTDRSVNQPEYSTDAMPSCTGIRSIVRDFKERTEMEMIQNALEAFGWNRRRVAQYLNISYRSLLYKIQQHRLRPWHQGNARQLIQNAPSTRQNAT